MSFRPLLYCNCTYIVLVNAESLMNLQVAKAELKDPPTVNLGAIIWEFSILVPVALLLIYILF